MLLLRDEGETSVLLQPRSVLHSVIGLLRKIFRLRLYSGHDSTVGPLLMALRFHTVDPA